jgi:eukaryotic-like serine/threonine-protein kinase
MSAYLGAGDLLDGKYRIIRVIGEGGWGVVYEGENARTLKRVAIKVLRTHAGVTPDIRARFEREAQAGGRIGSEHIVEVFDLGVLPDGTHFMVMELLVGEDLATRLRSTGPLEPVVAAKIFVQLLDGLGAAHSAGILHRDLKPENLFLVPTRSGEDFVKIVDFGVSKFTLPGMSATRTGSVLGSPFYMAPEQARGLKHVDGRTDLYSVGAVLFECVTGRVPFDGENFNDLMFKIVLAPRPNPLDLRPTLDPALVAIVVKAIAADPGERFASAGEFRAALVAWLESQGMGPVLTPDLRRLSKVTPTQRPAGDSQAPPTGWEARAPSVPRDAASVAPIGTPLVSSSGVLRGGTTRRTKALLAGAGAALAITVAGSAVEWQMHRTTGSAPPTSPPAALALPHADPPTAAVREEPTPTSLPSQVERLEPPATSDPVLSASAMTPRSGPPRAIPRFLLPARPPTAGATPLPPPEAAAIDAAPKRPDAPPSSAPPPAPPAAAAKETPRSFEKIEGREVRTGL